MLMKRQLVFVFLVFLLKHKIAYASMCPNNRYSELNLYLQGFTLESSRVHTTFECHRKCEQNILCSTININLTDKTCELKYSTKTRHPEKTVNRQNTVYMEARDDLGAPGSRSDRPIPSCKKLKEDDSQAKSGVYWMKFNEPSSAPFQVFCDMTTDGGGWTLVWSYTFTQYSPFNSLPNAVTPIPNWPIDKSYGTWVPQSTTTPLSDSSHSAMDFILWRKIGNDEFLLKSNITNWIACVEGTGSLLNWVSGSITCKVVKAMTPICTTIAPNHIDSTVPGGPGLSLDGKYMIHLEGKTDDNAPCHDPCGLEPGDQFRHLSNVPNYGSALYVR